MNSRPSRGSSREWEDHKEEFNTERQRVQIYE